MTATQSQLLGIPVEFAFGGKVYKIGPINFEVIARFCDWVYQSAIDRAERQRLVGRRRRSPTAEEQYERTMNRIADNQAAGKFEWEGDLVRTAAGQIPGIKTMLALRMQSVDPSVTPAEVEAIFADREAVERLGALLNPPADAADTQSPSPEAEAGPAA